MYCMQLSNIGMLKGQYQKELSILYFFLYILIYSGDRASRYNSNK
jgi:hypothetical protein